jgi:hypothetical protein
MSDQSGLTKTEADGAVANARSRIELGTLADVELEPRFVPIRKEGERIERFQLIDELLTGR